MDVIRDSAIVQLNRSNVGVLSVNLDATSDRFEIGDLTRTDVAQSESRLALARGDLRTISQDQTDRVATAMRDIVGQNLPGTGAEITFEFRYPPMSPTDGNRALLARLNTINVDLGLEPMEEYPPSRRGAADISFVAPLVNAALAGMGPNGAGSHAEGESADLSSFTRQAQRAAILISRLAVEPR